MSKVAILIPTLNRPEFLVRQIKYYIYAKNNNSIYIADSSDAENYEKANREIKLLKNDFLIEHMHCPERNFSQSMELLGTKPKEKYCVYNADDDFLIPKSIDKCVDFLENNSDYVMAQGIGVLMSLKDKYSPYGEFSYVGEYSAGKYRKSIAEDAKNRILDFAKLYWVTEPSVHKTENFLKICKASSVLKNKKWGEIFRCFNLISMGKSKFIDCLYVVRQHHEGRYFLQRNEEWFKESSWQQSYDEFINYTSKNLAFVDKISEDEAKKIVKKAINYYLKVSDKDKKSRKSIDTKKRNLLKKFITSEKLITLLKKIKSFYNVMSNRRYLSLESFLNPLSYYHKDFKLIFKIVTNKINN